VIDKLYTTPTQVGNADSEAYDLSRDDKCLIASSY